MKKLHFIFVITLFFNTVEAQQTILDSLKNKFLFHQMIEYVDNNHLTSPQEQLQKVYALDKLGHKKEAIVLLNSLLSKDSTNILYYDLLAEHYIEMGNYQRAYNLYKDAFRAYKSGYLLQKIAFMQFKLNQYVKCIESCDSFLQQDTTQAILRLEAAAYEKIDSLNWAKELLFYAVKRDKSDYRSYIKLSDLYVKEGNLDIAILLTEGYLQYDSLNYKVLEVNAKANFLNKLYDASEKKFQKLVDVGMNLPTSYYYLGVSNYFNEHYERAYENLYRANQLSNGKNVSVLYHLGMAAYQYSYKYAADKYLTKALKLSMPDSTLMGNMLVTLGDVNVHLSKYKKTVDYYKRAYKYQPKPSILYKIAYSYDNLKQYKIAINYYNKYLKSVLPNDTAQFHQVYKQQANKRIERLKEEIFME